MNNTSPMAVNRTMNTITNSRLFIEYKRICTDLEKCILSHRGPWFDRQQQLPQPCVCVCAYLRDRSRRSSVFSPKIHTHHNASILTVRIGRGGRPEKCIGWSRWTNRWTATLDFWSSSGNCRSASCTQSRSLRSCSFPPSYLCVNEQCDAYILL